MPSRRLRPRPWHRPRNRHWALYHSKKSHRFPSRDARRVAPDFVLRPGLRAAVAGVRGGGDAFGGARFSARLSLLAGRRIHAALRREPDAGGSAGPSARGRVRGRRGARPRVDLGAEGLPVRPEARGRRRDLLGFLADSRRGLAVQLPRRVRGPGPRPRRKRSPRLGSASGASTSRISASRGPTTPD